MPRRALNAVSILALLSSGLADPAGAQPPPERLSAPAARCAAAAFSGALGDRARVDEVKLVKAPVPHCQVRGTVTTRGEGAPDGAARFELSLPLAWNRRFLFLGGGGFDGYVPRPNPLQQAQGYATLATDSGHVQDPRYPTDGLDASWAVSADGAPDAARIADYAFRSRHQVNAQVRPAVARFYGADVARAYFIGCSGGGREALIEAQRWPGSYDGYIAGNPVTRPAAILLGARNFRALLQAPIPYDRFAAIDRAVMADCDAKDGVRDGLVQNPAVCSFDPRTLVADGVLSTPQAKALATYLSAVKDSRGRTVAFGSSPTGLGDLSTLPPGAASGVAGLSAYLTRDPPAAGDAWPWGPLPGGPVNWMLYNGAIGSLALARSELSLLDPSVSSPDGILSAAMVDAVVPQLARSGVEPEKMGAFFASGRKLIIYHGFDDTILDPYSTIATYRGIAEAGGGLDKARASARLFMAPNMGHCFGGSGPNVFDALGAMEAWVERGAAPDAILARRFKDNRPGLGQPVERTMPLCPFPVVARYDGRGDVNAASSWSCPTGDRRLLQSGPNGDRAGLSQVLASFR